MLWPIGKSNYERRMLWICTGILSLCLLYFAGSVYREYLERVSYLNKLAVSISDQNSKAVAGLLWEFNDAVLHEILEVQVMHPDLAWIKVYRITGSSRELAGEAYSVLSDLQSEETGRRFVSSQLVKKGDRVIGEVIAACAPSCLRANFQEHIWEALWKFVAVLAAVIGGASYWIKSERSRLILKESHDAQIAINSSLEREVMIRRQTEQQLTEAMAAAQAADRAKSNFLAMMSHELRTPMNGVIGFTDLLKMTNLNPEQEEYVDVIASSGRSLLEIINDILDYSKIEAGKLELHIEPFDLLKTVSEVVKLLNVRAKSKSVSLLLRQDPNLPSYLVGDAQRLRQILINLVGNAVKFTEQGGVEIQMDYKGVSVDGKHKIRISVLDSGIGMTAEQIKKLFQPFTQADTSTTRKFGGTGLGLAISKRLCEAMDGTIGADSVFGKGSTFWMDLIFSAAPEGVVQAHSNDATGKGSSLAVDIPAAILVVDDNAVNQRVSRLQLERLGYKPKVASHGFAALDMMMQEKFDVIFMDVQMQGADGYEITRRIRQYEESKVTNERSYIVALTAYALSGDREKALASGMDNYLSKPVQISDLERMLREFAAKQMQR